MGLNMEQLKKEYAMYANIKENIKLEDEKMVMLNKMDGVPGNVIAAILERKKILEDMFYYESQKEWKKNEKVLSEKLYENTSYFLNLDEQQKQNIQTMFERVPDKFAKTEEWQSFHMAYTSLQGIGLQNKMNERVNVKQGLQRKKDEVEARKKDLQDLMAKINKKYSAKDMKSFEENFLAEEKDLADYMKEVEELRNIKIDKKNIREGYEREVKDLRGRIQTMETGLDDLKAGVNKLASEHTLMENLNKNIGILNKKINNRNITLAETEQKLKDKENEIREEEKISLVSKEVQEKRKERDKLRLDITTQKKEIEEINKNLENKKKLKEKKIKECFPNRSLLSGVSLDDYENKAKELIENMEKTLPTLKKEMFGKRTLYDKALEEEKLAGNNYSKKYDERPMIHMYGSREYEAWEEKKNTYGLLQKAKEAFKNVCKNVFTKTEPVKTVDLKPEIEKQAGDWLNKRGLYASKHKNSTEFNRMMNAVDLVNNWSGMKNQFMENIPEEKRPKSLEEALDYAKEQVGLYKQAKKAQYRPFKTALRTTRMQMADYLMNWIETKKQGLETEKEIENLNHYIKTKGKESGIHEMLKEIQETEKMKENLKKEDIKKEDVKKDDIKKETKEKEEKVLENDDFGIGSL